MKKETLAQVFSCKFCEISKNTFLQRAPLMDASKLPAVYLLSANVLVPSDQGMFLNLAALLIMYSSVLLLCLEVDESLESCC